ncbi:MAG: hypothetical protein UY56_C0005G0034 [Parcubacteria group bacterium GW2011_GWA1_50_14]|uniref:Uncharacterized protein n=1 Tax=Candidatus Liptonbacteria bacterium GWB1_49_6 TaxID=1798644 RepID=A0A1G2C4X8_9BACT|nr:MAG: hypothetical protein UY56_C0005G0034 [Parcubacteria group bacterium GW2011_GWA1_50_14]OGY96473.1 MAG: hypothetical protein A2122_02125 [Candidatus Liptonbacteria bacterium GWB1_49_6]
MILSPAKRNRSISRQKTIPFGFDSIFANVILDTMALTTKSKFSSISIPVTLPQIAEGLKNLSKSELETIELLLNKEAMRIVKKSAAQVSRYKLKEL